jgi:hypothetical protein
MVYMAYHGSRDRMVVGYTTTYAITTDVGLQIKNKDLEKQREGIY